MKLYENMHRKLMRIIPNLTDIRESAKLKAEGYMDLNVDVLNRTATYTDIALSHYYRHPTGDMVADPDMEIRVWHYGAIEALAFQDFFGYKRVYPSDLLQLNLEFINFIFQRKFVSHFRLVFFQFFGVNF